MTDFEIDLVPAEDQSAFFSWDIFKRLVSEMLTLLFEKINKIFHQGLPNQFAYSQSFLWAQFEKLKRSKEFMRIFLGNRFLSLNF